MANGCCISADHDQPQVAGGAVQPGGSGANCGQVVGTAEHPGTGPWR